MSAVVVPAAGKGEEETVLVLLEDPCCRPRLLGPGLSSTDTHCGSVSARVRPLGPAVRPGSHPPVPSVEGVTEPRMLPPGRLHSLPVQAGEQGVSYSFPTCRLG